MERKVSEEELFGPRLLRSLPSLGRLAKSLNNRLMTVWSDKGTVTRLLFGVQSGAMRDLEGLHRTRSLILTHVFLLPGFHTALPKRVDDVTRIRGLLVKLRALIMLHLFNVTRMRLVNLTELR